MDDHTYDLARDFKLERLAASGLEGREGELGIEHFQPGKAAKAGGPADPRFGFVIPYHNVRGDLTGFNRCRFKTDDGTGSGNKYKQNGPGVEIYFPTTLKQGWESVIDSTPPATITITEGELKAAKACAEGIPTVAVGGVNSVEDVVNGGLHPDLASIGWGGRSAVIVFDNDPEVNKAVKTALVHLSTLLLKEGATTCTVHLPKVSETHKMGLDDYLVQHGVEAYRALVPEPVTEMSALLDGYYDRYVVYEHGSLKVVDLKQDDLLGAALSFQQWEKARSADFDRVGKSKKIHASTLFYESPRHLHTHGAVLKPGGSFPIVQHKDLPMLNLWTGWGADPWPHDVTDQDVSQWLELLDFLFHGDKDKIWWFERWCAAPFQHPGIKMYSAPYLYSKKGGLGKTILADTLQRLYGQRNTSHPSVQTMSSPFNPWSVKQFVVVDDLGKGSGGSRKVAGDRIKRAVTDETVDVNLKHHQIFTIDACCNFMLCSNEPDSIDMAFEERRYFVHCIRHKDAMERTFYSDYRKYFLDRPGGEVMSGPAPDGARKLIKYLMTLDLEDFDPKGQAPITDDMAVTVDAARNELDFWIAEMCEDPSDLIRHALGMKPYADEPDTFDGLDLYTRDQIVAAFKRGNNGSGFKDNTVDMTLKNHEFVGLVASNGRADHPRVSTKKYGRKKLFALRNQERWENADAQDAREHFNLYNGDKPVQ